MFAVRQSNNNHVYMCILSERVRAGMQNIKKNSAT